MKKIVNGKTITCTVTGIENYGIFVKINEEYSGLIHISEVSDLFVRDINDYVRIGEKIKAYVVDIDEKNKQIKLSLKKINDIQDLNKTDQKKAEEHRFLELEKNIKSMIKSKINEMEKNEKKGQ